MNAILQWLFNNTPGFIRGAVGWLLEGLRRIIHTITGAWNWLGVSVGRWAVAVAGWATHAVRFAVTVTHTLSWLKNVAIPRALANVYNTVAGLIATVDRTLRRVISSGLSALRHWADAAINTVRRIADAITAFATYWIGRIKADVASIVRALGHVLGGPDRLADWLIGAMLRALGRYLLSQGERIALWLLTSSPVFTLWLAREAERILLRVLR